MAEEYVGVKFEVRFLEKKEIIDDNIKELIVWCRKFNELGLAPKYDGGSAGNLSVRTEKGFIITGSNTDFSDVKEDGFVEVTNCDKEKKIITCNGVKKPSSESFLHYSIYKKRSDVNVIFHAHDDIVLKKLDEVATENDQPYGSIKLVQEVIKVLKDNYYIMMKNHGVISLGSTMEKAGELLIRKHEEAMKKR